MRTVETKVFAFDELSKEAKENAIEQYRKHSQEHGEYLLFFAESCDHYFTEAGFENTKLNYSLNYSQGDGLSFSAENYSKLEELYNKVLGKGKEKTSKLLADSTSVSISHNKGRYAYASKNDVELLVEDYASTYHNVDRIDEVCAKVEELLQEIYIDLCSTLEENGYAEIEYQDSDEAILEDIEANEFEFEEDGTQF
jgi:hypothetical protein